LDDPPSITDATLAEWRAGDRAAFLAAVGPWQDRIYRIVYRIVGTSHDVDEVWQTLMLRLLNGTAALPSAADFPAWLRRCAVNQAISFLRQQPAARSIPNEDPRQIVSSVPEPVETLVDAELRKQLADELARLLPEQRAILSLRFDECLTVREIAVVLERPPSTIHAQLKQTIERLQKRFGVPLTERVSNG
jgi:RNA polymerase sigma-70 factor, ECF subfamily